MIVTKSKTATIELSSMEFSFLMDAKLLDALYDSGRTLTYYEADIHGLVAVLSGYDDSLIAEKLLAGLHDLLEEDFDYILVLAE